ncbi:MAG: glycosyltransferase family 9 protein, partial [Gemmatimonadaceae bacterium]
MTHSARAAGKPNRIGIIMMSAAGDAVHTLPVVNALKQNDPSTHITWVLQPVPATLVRGHENVDSIIEFERSRGARAYLDVQRALREATLDLVIDLQVYLKAGLVTALANAPIKLGFDRARARDANWLFTNRKIPAHPVQHVQDQYFEFLDYLGVPHAAPEWKLGPWPDEREWQTQWRAQFDRPLAALVIATSKPEKDWLPERWAAVCDALYTDFGVQPVLVGGRSQCELDAEHIIMQRASHKPHSALGSGLRKLVSILDASSLVIAPDTGPLHMAVALDRPAISLLGYTNPKRTGPYRKFHDLMIDAYGDPGGQYAPSMENRPGRMQRINVEDVLGKIQVWDER